MKVILTGANGFLGQYLSVFLLGRGHQVVATGRGPARSVPKSTDGYAYLSVDVAEAQSFGELRLCHPDADVFIHTAAVTAVDDCEEDKAKAYATNVLGTQNALQFAAEHQIPFLFLSTDFVFDGSQGMYSEDDATAPVNYYGWTKKLAEELVMEYENPWSIIRTCLVYGNAITGTRSNIITWVRNNLEAGNKIKVVSDQVRTPTHVEDLALGVILAMEKKATGIYHISGAEVLTPYDMALRSAEMLRLDAGLIEKVDASLFSQPGKRPLRTGFNIDKARKELGFQPICFEEGVWKVFPDLKKGD